MDQHYVVKLLYDDAVVKARWVMAGCGRGLVTRDQATVFPDLEAATEEAKIWKALSATAFSVVVEPA